VTQNIKKMSTDLYNILSSAIAAEEMPRKLKSSKSLQSTSVPEPTVLLSGFPVTLDPKDYANPLSTANPNGDLIPLWRFRQLVDPIPQYSNVYIPSGNSLEMYYTQIIKGAIPKDENSFASMVIGNANKDIVVQTFSNMDGTPGSWCPVFAVPDDWYEIKEMSTVKQLSIDLSKMTNTFLNMGKESPLEWKITNMDNSTSEIALDKNSNISSAKVNYQMVSLNRPWFNSMIFETAGWYLNGQNSGFCSSGKNDGKGVLPIIPTSIIIGTEVAIQAEWSEKDMQIIVKAKDSNQRLSLGPLLVNAGQKEAQIHVIGWLVSEIPFSPQMNG
jgi:hypothetical protein